MNELFPYAYVSLGSLAAELNLPRAYLRRLAREKLIPALDVGGRLRFNMDSVRKALDHLAFGERISHMNTQSLLLLLQLISEGVGVAAEIQVLAQRIRRGEEITDAEIEAARAQVAASVSKWDQAAGNKPQ